MSNKVTFILNRFYSGDLKALALKNHVWIVGSENNIILANTFWTDNSDISYPDQGITTTIDSYNLLHLFYHYIDEIDLHHNSYSTDHPWDIMEIIGLSAAEVDINKIMECICDYSIAIIPIDTGFYIIKSAQQGEATEPAFACHFCLGRPALGGAGFISSVPPCLPAE
jgi:hypothetical protein